MRGFLEDVALPMVADLERIRPDTAFALDPDGRLASDVHGLKRRMQQASAEAGLYRPHLSPPDGLGLGLVDNFYIQDYSSQNIDATGNLFDAASNFRVEDKVWHKMDDDAVGLVTWVANNLYVTDAGTDHSIQHAIDIASAGNTINVEAGNYPEDVLVDKPLATSASQNSSGQPSSCWPSPMISSRGGSSAEPRRS